MAEVCIIGAGPAGLNAALVLGRCGRDVVVFDSGQPRNAASRGLHGYLTRDGVNPQELRTLGRAELARHASVRIVDQLVTAVQRRADGFAVITADGSCLPAPFVLLATGRVDVLPDKPGFREFYGRGVYHCPYCDGWEHRGQKLVIYGECADIVDYAFELLTWSRDVTLCAPDPARISSGDREKLKINGIAVADSPLVELTGKRDGMLTGARLANGTTLPCDALFFTSDLPQKSPFAQSLGCHLDEGGSVTCTEHAATGVAGLYVAGNVRGGVHLAIMAAAEGAEAAIAINEALADRALRRPPNGEPVRDTAPDQRPATGT